MKKSLICRKNNGMEIRIKNTFLNRLKARLRGYKLRSVIDWGATSKAKGGKR